MKRVRLSIPSHVAPHLQSNPYARSDLHPNSSSRSVLYYADLAHDLVKTVWDQPGGHRTNSSEPADKELRDRLHDFHSVYDWHKAPSFSNSWQSRHPHAQRDTTDQQWESARQIKVDTIAPLTRTFLGSARQ